MSNIGFYIVAGWALAATYLWLREDQRRRDFQTDMFQLIYDYDVSSDELRRTRDYKCVKRRAGDVEHIHTVEDDGEVELLRAVVIGLLYVASVLVAASIAFAARWVL